MLQNRENRSLFFVVAAEIIRNDCAHLVDLEHAGNPESIWSLRSFQTLPPTRRLTGGLLDKERETKRAEMYLFS